MKLATLALATALGFTSTFALAQSGGGSAGGSISRGWYGGKRNDDRTFR